MDKNKNNKSGFYEDETEYGEIIPSMFAWLTMSGQKERADELNEMTKKKNKS